MPASGLHVVEDLKDSQRQQNLLMGTGQGFVLVQHRPPDTLDEEIGTNTALELRKGLKLEQKERWQL